jgi:hypothetical protein
MPMMDALLRKLVELKARRRAAQVIIFDGAADYDRTRSFVRGAACGVTLTLVIFLLSAPDSPDDRLVRAIAVREDRLQEAQERLQQAMAVADVCLNTAQNLERTLAAYQAFLGGRTPTPPIPILPAHPAD